jgi:hypothetical protein
VRDLSSGLVHRSLKIAHAGVAICQSRILLDAHIRGAHCAKFLSRQLAVANYASTQEKERPAWNYIVDANGSRATQANIVYRATSCYNLLLPN